MLLGVEEVGMGSGETTCKLGDTVERGIWIRVDEDVSSFVWPLLVLLPEALLDLWVCLWVETSDEVPSVTEASGRGCSGSILIEPKPETLRLVVRESASLGESWPKRVAISISIS